MKQAQIVMKLVLDKLGIDSNISTLADRKRVQKAIYISQSAGVNLGYSYGWYLLGPYSPELTQDYFSLNENIKLGDEEYKNYVLNDSLSKELDSIRDLMEPPCDVGLKQEDWLELVASIHYLIKVDQKNKDGAKSSIGIHKEHLLPFFEEGYASLKNHGMI